MKIEAGIVVRGEGDFKTAAGKAKKMGVGCIQGGGDWTLPWARTLFLSTMAAPWDLLPVGFHLLERWDAAAPLWRYGALAANTGTAEERKRTLALTHDLRLLLYAPELLFVRDSEAGRALVEAWREECGPTQSAPSLPSPVKGTGEGERLAFLRALYRVKPLFCALPRSWLAPVQERSVQDARSKRSVAVRTGPLVTVEIAPGRLVKCYAGTEEEVRRLYQGRKGRRK